MWGVKKTASHIKMTHFISLNVLWTTIIIEDKDQYKTKNKSLVLNDRKSILICLACHCCRNHLNDDKVYVVKIVPASKLIFRLCSYLWAELIFITFFYTKKDESFIFNHRCQVTAFRNFVAQEWGCP